MDKVQIAFLLIILSTVLALGELELFLGILACVPLFILFRLSLLHGSFEVRLLSLTYILGSIICWVIGFLGCIYNEFGLVGFKLARHPLITLTSINLVTWGSLVGSLIAIPIKKSTDNKLAFTNLPENLKLKGFKVTGVIFIFFLAMTYAAGGFHARFETGSNLPTNSPLYFLQGISVLQLLVFLFAGSRLSSPLFNRNNISIFLVPLAGSLIFSLMGGRETSLRIIIYFLLGTFYSKIDLKQVRLLVLSTIPIALALIIFVGFARSNVEFAHADLGTRVQIIYKAAVEGPEPQGNEYDNPWYGLFTRMTEASGQLVIDGVYETNEYIGFANLERVIMNLLPKFIYPGDKVYDDGNERLEKYGIFATKFTSAPITLMADSFERGGFFAVFLISLIFSFCLTAVGYIISRNQNGLLKVTLLITFGLLGIRFYSFSVLGIINFFTYTIFRDTILIFLLFWSVGLTKNYKINEIKT